MQLQAKELLDLRHAMQASMESDDDEEWGEESPEEPLLPQLPGEEEEGDEKEGGVGASVYWQMLCSLPFIGG